MVECFNDNTVWFKIIEEEITGATLRNFITAITLFCDMFLDVLKLEGEGIKSVKQDLVSITVAKKNAHKEKDVLDNLRSSKKDSNNSTDIINDNQNKEFSRLDDESYNNDDENRKF